MECPDHFNFSYRPVGLRCVFLSYDLFLFEQGSEKWLATDRLNVRDTLQRCQAMELQHIC